MARRVFLHVGTMKSGTSFLQSLWWRHRDALADQGLLLPGDRLRDHFRAASLTCGREQILAGLTPEERRTWEVLHGQVGAWDGDALVSHELFSPATPEQAARTLQRLGEHADEVHVVVTARDLARQLPSHWQEHVKHHGSETLTDYWRQVSRDDPGDPFWTYQDVPALLGRWTQGLPASRGHLVVVPRQADRAWLWRATATLLGVDPEELDLDARNPNESLGIGEIEVMRRLQSLVPEAERDLELTRLTKGFVSREVLRAAGPGGGFVPPPALHAWARERGAVMVAELQARGYDVVGDLADLLPPETPAAGRVPEEVTAEEVADVAVAALARMVVHDRDQRRRLERLRARRQRRRGPAAPPAASPRTPPGRWAAVRRRVGLLRGGPGSATGA